MKLRYPILTVGLLVALWVTGCDKSAPHSSTAAPTAIADAAANATAGPKRVTYLVEFKPLWLKTNFPYEYPDTSLIHKPHFSGWIGTGHNESFQVFMEGVPPTAGLEMLSEMGKHEPMNEEINAAIDRGNAIALSESDPLRDFGMTVSFKIDVDEAHPWASAVAMIAPSPDWFTGFNVNLMEGGDWQDSKTIEVMAWDSGGDDGASYLADDINSTPKKPTTPASLKHFTKDGKTIPVGTVMFTRM